MHTNQPRSSSVDVFTQGLKQTLSFFKFDPVDLVCGRVMYEGVDFSLPGPIPFEWKRVWYSDSQYQGALGHGVHFAYDRYIQIFPKHDTIGMLLSDGRVAAFPDMAAGESFYLRQEKITLVRFADGFEAFHHEENLNYVFSRQGADYYKLTRIEREGGCNIRFGYRGRVLQSVTDSAGRSIEINTDAQGRITAATVSVGPLAEKKISYSYDADGNMSTITDALGQSTTIEFDNYKMVKKTDRNGQSFYWEYDHLGRCIHTWGDGRLQEGWLEYHTEKGYNKIIEAGGAATIYHYDDNQLVRRIVNPMGAFKLFQYTEYMELYREVDEDGNLTGYTYNDRGLITGITYPDGTERKYMYDKQDRLIISISPGGAQEVYTYYEDSNLARAVIHADRTSTKYTYNKAGLPETIKKGDNLLQLAYDRFYNLIELTGNEQKTQWNYDLWGDVIRVEDAVGSVQRYRYDQLGRVTAITQADGAMQQLYYNAYDEVTEIDRNGETVATFAYTPLGSLLKRRQGATQVRFSYDRMERLMQVVNEHNETYTFSRNRAGDIVAETGFDAITRHYLRSPAGRVLGIKGPGGMDTRYRYNGKGQITYAEYSDGTWESYSYDKDGLLTAAQNEHSHITLERDGNGRILAETQSRGIADEGHTVTSYYDEDGLRLHIGSTLGADITQQYNEQGYLNHIQANTTSTAGRPGGAWEAHIQRNARGQATAYEFTGGVHSSFEYDSAGRPIAQTVKTGRGRESYKRSYHWNAANQLVQPIDHVKNKGISYTYDALNQLVSATIGNAETEMKKPDAVGNLYETPDRKDRNYSNGGRLERDKNWHYYYDTLGNLKLKSPYPLHGKDPSKKWQPGCWFYEWYANGILKSVQKPGGAVVSFEYDALGRRTAKIAGKKITRYLWDGNVLLHEWSYDIAERPVLQVGELGKLFYDRAEPTINLVSWIYEQGSFTPIAKLVDGERYSIISDYLGTPIQAFDSNGEVVWERELNIYGGVRKETGIANFVAMRYQGQYFDEETGLCYNRFRYYDPESGCYISQDPIGLMSGCWAFYAYVKDLNRFIDTFGLYNGEGTRELGVYDTYHTHVLGSSEYTKNVAYHFGKANESLHNRFQSDPKFAAAMETKYPGIVDHVSPGINGSFSERAAAGTTWHHAETPGHLELVDRVDHKTYHKVYHPDGEGGRKKWGGGNVCR